MNLKQLIEKNMKQHTQTEPEIKAVDVSAVPTHKHNAVPSDEIHFRVKISHMVSSGKLHIQLGAPDPHGLQEKIIDDLGTWFVCPSGNVVRNYGLSFDILTADGSYDNHQLKELGMKVQQTVTPVKSLAEASDYTYMVFEDIVDGKNNNNQDVKLMQFYVGNPEHKLYIAFSHLSSVVPRKEGQNYDELRGEWFLAYLVSNFIVKEGEADEY